jgi:hypothetical protein
MIFYLTIYDIKGIQPDVIVLKLINLIQTGLKKKGGVTVLVPITSLETTSPLTISSPIPAMRVRLVSTQSKCTFSFEAFKVNQLNKTVLFKTTTLVVTGKGLLIDLYYVTNFCKKSKYRISTVYWVPIDQLEPLKC